jgi:microcystin degradation protein MlrC
MYEQARVRSLIGPSVPLVVSLDMHAVLTPRMAEHADILVPFHTYPHVDQYQTGVRAARCLLRMLDEPDLAPQIVWRRLPMLVRGDELITGRVPSSKSSSGDGSSGEDEGGQGSWQYTAAVGAFGGAIEMCQAIEEDGQGGIAAGVLIGNAFTDVPGLGSSVVVVREGGAAQRTRADRACQRLGAYMWAHRHVFRASLTPLADAISLAEAALPTTRGRTGGTVTVLSDAADATSSGASGDSNAVIGAVLRHRFSGRALVPIVDAAAVLAAQRAGVGAELRLRLGGTLDPQRFSPLPLTATVLALHHDTSFTYENGTSGSAGHVALLRCCATAGVPAGGTAGELHVLACTIPAYFVGQCVFVALGTPPAEYDLIVVKSPNGFRPHYASIAQQIIPVDGCAPPYSLTHARTHARTHSLTHSLTHARSPQSVL